MLKLIKLLEENFQWKATILIVATAVSYAFLINNFNLWLDEIYSVLMAKDSFSDMWVLLSSEDSKPPLYYLYLKVILKLFPSQYEIWTAHFSSAILLIGAQIFAATVIKKDFGEKVALWLMFLLATVPYSLWLALEVRTYMLSSFLLLIAAGYGIRLLKSPRRADFIKFAVISILSLYSHYYCALWLMFFYAGLLYCLLKNKTFKKNGKAFIVTAIIVAVCFLPWLCIPLGTGQTISQFWYVNLDFVNFSWQFFTNPLQPEILQSVFFIATTFATSVFSFILLLGIFGLKKDKKQQFWLIFGSFIATYGLLLILSYTVRPMVTARYLKIYSLILYFAVSLVISEHKNIQKAFIVVALIGFIFTWIDIRAVSFNKGYQAAVSDIRRFITTDKPLLAFDNSNLFCEYYLPEYDCLLITDNKGEILRRPKVLKNIGLYEKQLHADVFSISIFSPGKKSDDCLVYDSIYRNGQDVKLCRYSISEATKILKSSAESLKWTPTP